MQCWRRRNPRDREYSTLPLPMTVRTRFAPSPTGRLHLGGARTAIFNWLIARHHGGSFILRIEDTDSARNVRGAEAELLADLRWLGIDWDEGPEVGGAHAPYRQSERGGLYRERAEELLQEGKAFWCICPPASLEEHGAARERPRCPCRTGGLGTAPGIASLRFLVPDGDEVVVEDGVRGRVTFAAADLEDFVLLRSDGRPTYNFAAAVDDREMEVTRVIRGADHLGNTPKQLLLYRAFGWDPPAFEHLPLILGADRQKLSKRHGATSVTEHRRAGYLPDALFNYLSLLGWSSPSGDEVLSRDRLIQEVDLGRVGSADAVFDPEKLRWLSSRYLQALPAEALARGIADFVDRDRFRLPAEALPALAEGVRSRISTFSGVNEELPHFLGSGGSLAGEGRERLHDDPEARRILTAVRGRLEALPAWETPALHAAIREAGKDAGVRGPALFHPLRLALTGEEHGPDLAQVAAVQGRTRVLEALAFDGG